jgi:uncharacterized protein YyaL (SSP411 family)
MPNRLISETSPYLLQHAHNPVDWYAWGDEAFGKARAEDKPVFLSIGYSACHWCHVMERESFESDEVAEILNREFVSIKVDREERPDIDSIYMQAVQMLTGHGGWPMSMFLTPEGAPFYGGTYFPPDDRHGMPGFKRVLTHVAEVYRNQKDDVARASAEVRTAIAQAMRLPSGDGTISHAMLNEAAQRIAVAFDPLHGGFGSAPKFPPSMTLEFLMQVARRLPTVQMSTIISTSLTKMARGGIYDQIGGGFHRYSVDARWLVPHFEKMLYDNALLARLYVHAWQWSKLPEFARVAREIFQFVQREMTSAQGGFYSTLDADSEGEEGKFYVWTRPEVLSLLGEEEGRIFCALYDISENGNWEGKNILHLPRDTQVVADDFGLTLEKLNEIVERGRQKLYAVRAKRVWPARDEKILAGWNGWMLAAFAEGSLAFGSDELRDQTRRNADFLLDRMMEGDRLYRSYKDGQRRIGGLLEDYAGVAWGLIAAFEATQVKRYLMAARDLASQILERFDDKENGGFFDTPIDHEELITRPKDLFDNATPSGNSVALEVLLKLAKYFGEERFQRAATRGLASTASIALRYPTGFGFLLCVAEWAAGKPKEIAITGKGEHLVRTVGAEYVPHRILVWSDVPELPLMQGKTQDRTLAYLCEDYVCQEPSADPDGLRKLLQQ